MHRKRLRLFYSQAVSPMLSRGEYKRGVGWTYQSDSAFCQITLVLVIITSALEVINVMRSMNPRFTYLLTYLLTITIASFARNL